MNLTLSLKILALLAFVVAATAAIVHPAAHVDSEMTMASTSTSGLPLPTSFH